MTQGGTSRNEKPVYTGSAFAPLRQWAKADATDVAPTIKNLASELSSFDGSAELAIELLDGERSTHWMISFGMGDSDLEQSERKGKAEIRLVVRRETWLEIAQGKLNPFDAFAGGKLLVGGDTDLAKRLVNHLSDPSFAFVSPC